MRKEPVRPTPSCAQQQTYYWGDTKLFIQSHEPVCVCFVQAEIQDQEQRLYFMIMSIEICNLWRRSNASFKWGGIKKSKMSAVWVKNIVVYCMRHRSLPCATNLNGSEKDKLHSWLCTMAPYWRALCVTNPPQYTDKHVRLRVQANIKICFGGFSTLKAALQIKYAWFTAKRCSIFWLCSECFFNRTLWKAPKPARWPFAVCLFCCLC